MASQGSRFTISPRPKVQGSVTPRSTAHAHLPGTRIHKPRLVPETILSYGCLPQICHSYNTPLSQPRAH